MMGTPRAEGNCSCLCFALEFPPLETVTRPRRHRDTLSPPYREIDDSVTSLIFWFVCFFFLAACTRPRLASCCACCMPFLCQRRCVSSDRDKRDTNCTNICFIQGCVPLLLSPRDHKRFFCRSDEQNDTMYHIPSPRNDSPTLLASMWSEGHVEPTSVSCHGFEPDVSTIHSKHSVEVVQNSWE